jgi:hypothetical protein
MAIAGTEDWAMETVTHGFNHVSTYKTRIFKKNN